jgi:hypothetical protein
VRRIAETLNGLLSTLQQNPQWNSPDAATILEKAPKWEMQILTAYSAWDVFREKLALRQDDKFSDLLAACDDLTWECYEPAMTAYSPGKAKQPPLVYLNTTWNPMLRRRDSSYGRDVEEGLDSTRETLTHPAFLETIQKLAVPLLGLPWFLVAHMPSAILIAHEVGHAVEFDFGLTEALQSALTKAGLEEPYEWSGCAREVFADLYGVLWMGRYLAGAVLDVNLASRAKVDGDQNFGKYPPRPLRGGRLFADAARGRHHEVSLRRHKRRGLSDQLHHHDVGAAVVRARHGLNVRNRGSHTRRRPIILSSATTAA